MKHVALAALLATAAYGCRGQQSTTLMHENPGPFLQVHVSVDPVGR